MSRPSLSDRFIRQWQRWFSSRRTVLVAVSGGSDSVALLHLLADLRSSLSVERLGVAHVNHGLRPESDDEERFVRALCEKRSLEFFSTRLSEKSPDESGIESWARTQRYRFFHTIAHTSRYDAIATGHTENDQAESVLLNLFRGCGFGGLCGIRRIREDGVIRPLLDFTREELREWLDSRAVPFVDDPSNDSPRFRRNWIRHELLSLIAKRYPAVKESIGSTARSLARLQPLITAAVDEWIDAFAHCSDDSFCVSVRGMHHPQAHEAFAELLKRYTIARSFHHITRSVSLCGTTGKTVLLPGGWICRSEKQHLIVHRDDESAESNEWFQRKLRDNEVCVDPRTGERITLSTGDPRILSTVKTTDNFTAHLDADACRPPLYYRPGRSDDTICPFGSTRCIGLHAFLKKQGLSREERERAAVVVNNDDEVVWIPGVRIDRRFKVTGTTRRIFTISCRPDGK